MARAKVASTQATKGRQGCLVLLKTTGIQGDQSERTRKGRPPQDIFENALAKGELKGPPVSRALGGEKNQKRKAARKLFLLGISGRRCS